MDWAGFLSQFRGIHFVIMIILFLGVCWWAFSPGRKKANQESAQLPFDDDEMDKRTQLSQREKKDDE